MQSFPLTIALLLMLCQKGEETWLKNYCRQFYRNFYGPSKAAALAKSSYFWEKMRSRFFHVFAESSSPSLARFLPREVGLISTLYVFGDAFWLPICKTCSSQLYEHGSTIGSCLKTSIAIVVWIVNILLYIYLHTYLCMSTTFS